MSRFWGSPVTPLPAPPPGLVLCLGVAARALWREWRRRSTNSISFTNATFRKGPGDPLDGGGLEDPLVSERGAGGGLEDPLLKGGFWGRRGFRDPPH